MAGKELAVVVLWPWRAFGAVHWHRHSRALWARQGRTCARASARVMYRDKEKGGALGLLGGETMTAAMASTYRRARQAWGLTMGLRWLEWRCSGEVWPCVILSCDPCVFNTKVFLSRSNAQARYHVIIKQNKCS